MKGSCPISSQCIGVNQCHRGGIESILYAAAGAGGGDGVVRIISVDFFVGS